MLDSSRVVLYREDFRDIPYVFHQNSNQDDMATLGVVA